MAEAKTIDEVIDKLGQNIEAARAEQSRLGFFAALYRKVTIRVRDAIAGGFFEDGPRMEALDVRFANRYLVALANHRDGQPVTRSWNRAFEASQDWWPIVLQHLLLGMNAHINLDLCIAAARTAPGDQLEDLQTDFDRINAILAALVDEVRAELAQVWPLLGILNRTLSGAQDAIVNFSMERARDEAWRFAERLAPLAREGQESQIAHMDTRIAALAGLIRHPGFTAGTALRVIRLGERGSVPHKIAILE